MPERGLTDVHTTQPGGFDVPKPADEVPMEVSVETIVPEPAAEGSH